MTGLSLCLAILGWLAFTAAVCLFVGYRLRQMDAWDKTAEREEYIKAVKRVQGR